MAVAGIVDTDLISELPEPILLHILSLMPLKDAARTSILSKRWNCIWNTLPHLNFDREFFGTGNIFVWNLKQRKKNKYLLKAADKIILSRCQQKTANIQKLSLVIPKHEISRKRRELEIKKHSHLSFKLERWMRGVANSSLRELNLDIRYNGRHYQTLPSTILLAKSINVLSLSGLDLMSLSSLDIKFPSLRNLHLYRVYLEDHIMGKLIVGCPLLENLQVSGCEGLKTIYAAGLPQLKLFDLQGVRDLMMLKIEDLPDLQVLRINISSNSCRVDVATCACLRKLRLWGAFITENGFHKLVSQCLFLEDLFIGGSDALENIKISTETLKKLNLIGLGKLAEVEINAPILENLYFLAGKKLSTFSLNASDVLEVRLDISSVADEDLSHDQLIKFLGYFNHLKSVNLSGPLDKIIIPKEKRDILLSPLYGVGHLVLTSRDSMKSLVVELVEYMLWLSPGAESLSMTRLGYRLTTETVLFKFLYKKDVAGHSSSPCCKSLPSVCWRHSLAEVSIEKFDGDEDDQTNVKSFFNQFVKNLKIVETSSKLDFFCDGLYSFYDELFSH